MLPPDTAAALRDRLRLTGPTGSVPAAPADWEAWLKTLFPRYISAPFAPRHVDFWQWVDAIELGEAPAEAFVAVWPRGGGKSTNAELATTKLGVRGKRRYALYVRETQGMADKSVSNIAAMLEGAEVARYYPQHAERQVGKYGNSKGWRRNRLRTAGGFIVDAIGLDTATRGVKVEDQRPDFIVLDDIDGKHDTPAVTARKTAIITTSILPAGSPAVAVLAIQNLIHADGFFTRLVDGRADYLASRYVSGPHPAVEGLQTAIEVDPESGTRRAVIVGGTPTWAGQDLDACQRQIDLFGLSAFLTECQHEVTDRSDMLALRMDERRHVEDVTDEECRALVALGRPFAGIDFGAWRFGFVLRAVDRAGKVHEIAEYFSQRESLETRARAIDAICRHYGVPSSLRIRGDAANPTDIRELNDAFQRIGSRLRCVAVAMVNKERKTSVERINDLLDRDALCYRRGVHTAVAFILADVFGRPASDFLAWRLGYNASSAGVEMTGSRLVWEVQHWAFPVPKEGKAQGQDPSDDTADGADLLAADRYAIMSFLRPAATVEPEEDDHTISPALWRQHVEQGRRPSLRRRPSRRGMPADLLDPAHGAF